MLLDIYKPLMEKSMPPRKKTVRKGTLDLDIVEASPVVWQGRLLRFEWIRPNDAGESGYYGADTMEGYSRFVDMETDQVVSSQFAHGKSYGCAYEEDGVMYVFQANWAKNLDNTLEVFWSRDLQNWESKEIIRLPEEILVVNSSVCKGKDGYYMMFEIKEKNVPGATWCAMFARSQDLMNWTLLSDQIHRDLPPSCPVMRYSPADEQYYIISTAILPYFRILSFITRTKDFEQFEMGLVNPVMYPDDEDKKIYYPEKFTPEQLERIRNATNCNSSDFDVCEYNGKTVILYAWGNQLGKEFLGLAEYDGTVDEFMRSFFAD